MKKKLALALTAVLAVVGLSGCGMNDSLRDYEEAQVKDPESITLWNNVDGHPNIARVCTDGVAWATTTRPDFSALTRVPEWDAFCATQGDRASKNTD